MYNYLYLQKPFNPFIFMNEILDKILVLCDQIKEDAPKDSKAARKRIRKATLELNRLGKEYRKLSIEADA